MSAVVDVAPFISKRARLWKACGIRGLLPLENIPGIISMRAGEPNSATFPFESITMKLRPTLAGLQPSHDSDDPFTITLEGAELISGLKYYTD
uniref:Uncharacterized protein n=1 Tax=Mycena chlorophos TaxID=658473 RepID=A0ABQ0L7F5_MYCCL|nr:predicted protein [Mycena chlorophos]